MLHPRSLRAKIERVEIAVEKASRRSHLDRLDAARNEREKRLP
jgi:hypothetical protein